LPFFGSKRAVGSHLSVSAGELQASGGTFDSWIVLPPSTTIDRPVT
jgi:hypothetical protein